jgi:glycosyltransferase involved in cell wall biosynthesis
LKVAIIHDWLTGMRGGEKVLDSLFKLYPDADLFSLIYNPGKLNARIEQRKITTAFTDRLPFKASKYRWYLPLFPTAIESFDLRGYDLILSSSHCVAKGVIPSPNSFHLTYIHSPMRYVWDMFYDYFPARSGVSFLFYQMVANYLRIWDTTSSARVDYFTCNSDFVGKRIQKYYRRDYKVVFPPCLPKGYKVFQREKEDFYLIVSAFAPYKKIDLAIEAFRVNKKKLIIIGGGQDEAKIKKNLPTNVTILHGLSREEVESYYSRARGFIFPGLEDFGITPVEAQGYCTPVIAFGQGGALETVVSHKTGVFFPEQTVLSLNAAIADSDKISYKNSDFQKSVNRFTEEKFINEIKNTVDRHK